jgi:hypothetical protein
MTNSLENIQHFLDMSNRMFGQVVSINIWFSFGLCDVMTALDPPFERLFQEDLNGAFCFKGGVNIRLFRDIYIINIDS